MIKAYGVKFIDSETNKQFVPIGYTAGNFTDYTDAQMHIYMKNFTEHKGNVLRFMFGRPTYQKSWPCLETAAGEINPNFTEWMNKALSWCSQYNVKVIVTLWSWWTNYYGSQNTFFSPQSWPNQKKVIDYLTQNWGNSPSIFAWELFNEMPWDNSLTSTWISELSKYTKSKTAQMVGVSAGSWKMGNASSMIWACPTLDYASSHAYDMWGDGLVFWMGFAKRLQNVTTIMNAIKGKTDKPFIDNEIPGIPTNFMTKLVCMNMGSNEAYAQSFLDVGKAYLANGAASPGLTWPANVGGIINGVWCELTELLYDMQSRFTEDIFLQ